MRRMAVVMLFALVFGTAFAEPPPIVGGGGVTLKDLAGTTTLVTVVLKPSGVLDQDLYVVTVLEDRMNVISTTDVTSTYLFSLVQEIRVQDGRVKTPKSNSDKPRALSAEAKTIVESAEERAKQIYEAADTDQSVKMRAAALLALNKVAEPHEYLRQLAASGDLETELDATLYLYLAGDTEPAGRLLEQGLESGNAKIKAKAAQLVGLLGDAAFAPALLKMADDRDIDIAGPAVRALARLGNRDVIDRVLQLLVLPAPEKGDVVLFALTRLGDKKVIAQLKDKLNTTSGLIRQRVIVLLYELGDPQGKILLKKESMEAPTLRFKTALVLAKNGDHDGKQYLSKRLRGAYNEKEGILIERIRAAEALYRGGNSTVVSVFQDLLRSSDPKIKKMACQSVASVGDLELLRILQPVVPQYNFDVALGGCYAMIALAQSDFRERYVESLDITP